jgi:hypothetical protein
MVTLTKQSNILKEDWKYILTPRPYILTTISNKNRQRKTNSITSVKIKKTSISTKTPQKYQDFDLGKNNNVNSEIVTIIFDLVTSICDSNPTQN